VSQWQQRSRLAFYQEMRASSAESQNAVADSPPDQIYPFFQAPPAAPSTLTDLSQAATYLSMGENYPRQPFEYSQNPYNLSYPSLLSRSPPTVAFSADAFHQPQDRFYQQPIADSARTFFWTSGDAGPYPSFWETDHQQIGINHVGLMPAYPPSAYLPPEPPAASGN
jgi:hypothetical protein